MKTPGTMKKNDQSPDRLQTVLKRYGTESPSAAFSARLTHRVVTSHKISYARRYRKEERLGKCIIGVLISCCLLVLVEMNLPVAVLERIIPVFALAAGLLLLILMVRKLADPTIPSG